MTAAPRSCSFRELHCLSSEISPPLHTGRTLTTASVCRVVHQQLDGRAAAGHQRDDQPCPTYPHVISLVSVQQLLAFPAVQL